MYHNFYIHPYPESSKGQCPEYKSSRGFQKGISTGSARHQLWIGRSGKVRVPRRRSPRRIVGPAPMIPVVARTESMSANRSIEVIR